MDQGMAKRQKKDEGDVGASIHDSSATQAFTNQALTDEGRTSEQRQVNAVFGETQGPAGSAISEDPKNPADSSSMPGGVLRPPELPSNSDFDTIQSGDEQVSGFEPGIVAIEDRLHDGDWAGADAALQALDQAKHKSKSENAVIDALMEAEQEFDQKKGDAQASQGMAQRLSQRLESSEGNPSTSASLRRNGSKGAVQIEDSNRVKIRGKMLEALQKSAQASSMSHEQHKTVVKELEDQIHQSCSSRPVYFSKAGNMSRLLSKLSSQEELEDLPRIASGLSKQVLQGVTQTMIPRQDATGLQGLVPK